MKIVETVYWLNLNTHRLPLFFLDLSYTQSSKLGLYKAFQLGCSWRVGDVDPGGVANLSWAGSVIFKDTLKLEPRAVVCSVPYGGSD